MSWHADVADLHRNKRWAGLQPGDPVHVDGTRLRGASWQFVAHITNGETGEVWVEVVGGRAGEHVVRVLLVRRPGWKARLQDGLHLLAENLFAPPANRAKSGSIMDPNGLASTAVACRGSVMDPNGCTVTGNQAGKDLGSIMDPDG